jgi:hypothetical protein
MVIPTHVMFGLIIKSILLSYHHYYQGIFTPKQFHQTHIQQLYCLGLNENLLHLTKPIRYFEN